MFEPSVENDIRAAALALDLDPAAALAIGEIVGGAVLAAEVAGRMVPAIDWRHHVFHRRLRPEARGQAVRTGLAAPLGAAPEQPPRQRERWALFSRALLIDRDAAHAACAWGLGRVPGEAALAAGYEGAEALSEEVASGAAGQLRAFLRYAEASGAAEALASGDWRAFAERYPPAARCGPSAEIRLARAQTRWRARPPAALRRPLASGDCGLSVMRLQRRLRALGAEIRADGVFGARTRAALIVFQDARRLPAHGRADAETLAALAAAGRDAA